MAPIAAGPAPSRKARAPAVAGIRSNCPTAPPRTNTKDGREGDHRGEDPADQARGGVADNGDGLYDRAGGDLAEGDRVEELRAGHPVIMADRIGLHERDDHESAAVGQGTDLERHPRY